MILETGAGLRLWWGDRVCQAKEAMRSYKRASCRDEITSDVVFREIASVNNNDNNNDN